MALPLISQPGPGPDGFHVHVMAAGTPEKPEVTLVFGEAVNHLPMRPLKARELARAILAKLPLANKLVTPAHHVSMSVMGGRVVIELMTPVSELTLSVGQARDVLLRLCDTASRIDGRR